VEDRFEPVDLIVKRDEGLTISFADGHVARFELAEIRLACPCATCRSLRDRGEAAWPRSTSPLPLRIEDARLHGAWGLNITWNDGHATGIYPFEALRNLSDGQPPFGPDSGLWGAVEPTA
jgi:prepilin-type processing-associated H-X9-DG protein